MAEKIIICFAIVGVPTVFATNIENIDLYELMKAWGPAGVALVLLWRFAHWAGPFFFDEKTGWFVLLVKSWIQVAAVTRKHVPVTAKALKNLVEVHHDPQKLPSNVRLAQALLLNTQMTAKIAAKMEGVDVHSELSESQELLKVGNITTPDLEADDDDWDELVTAMEGKMVSEGKKGG